MLWGGWSMRVDRLIERWRWHLLSSCTRTGELWGRYLLQHYRLKSCEAY